MKLNLRQIEVFKAVMTSGSISGAAKLLFVSQPAVSRLILHTEERLGFALFQRIKGRLYPTPEAHHLYAEVKVLHQNIQRVEETAERLRENRVGQLRLAFSPSLSQSIIPKAIAVFRHKYPDIHIKTRTLVPSTMLQALLTQQSDLGIAYTPVDHPNLASRVLYQNRMVAVLPDNHRLATHGQITAHALSGEPLIKYSDDIPFAILMHDIFDGHDMPSAACIEVQQAHVACALAQAGAGIALVDEATVKGISLPNMAVIPIATSVNAPISVFHQKYKPLSRVTMEFLDVLKNMKVTEHPECQST